MLMNVKIEFVVVVVVVIEQACVKCLFSFTFTLFLLHFLLSFFTQLRFVQCTVSFCSVEIIKYSIGFLYFILFGDYGGYSIVIKKIKLV